MVIPKVKAHKVDNIHVYIICPYCKKEHKHGSCGGTDYGGTRVAHCSKGVGWTEGLEYEIMEMSDDKW